MKFKKYIALLLSAFILLMNSSFGLVYHYCHDEIAYVAIKFQEKNIGDSVNEDSCCSSDDSIIDDEDGCCKNEVVKLEKKDVFQISKNFDFKLIALIPSIPVYHFFQKKEYIALNQKLDYYVESNAPPLYKLNSQFIFYA